MKPRIVRESISKYPISVLCEGHKGTPYLALPWPKVGTGPGECPYTPEQVMAACERDGCIPSGVPRFLLGGRGWAVPIYATITETFRELTPEFMGEPKRCEHGANARNFEFCPKCGERVVDRRKEQRRKGERRAPTSRDRRMGFVTRPGCESRRSGRDRRQAP